MVGTFDTKTLLQDLGLNEVNKGTWTGVEYIDLKGEWLSSHSPVDGKEIGKIQMTTRESYEKVIEKAGKAFKVWRNVPAPQRGEVVRQIGIELRNKKDLLGKLVSYEMGKSYQEGLGEVQEMIDICDFAVGLSRQLYGLTMHSERPGHRMYEQWHPLGIVGVISAFNFPVAVWSWNTMIAWVCGDVCVWKPSEKTPLTSLACQVLAAEVFKKNGYPEGITSMLTGGATVGAFLTQDPRVALISATGSTNMGKAVGETVGGRLGKVLLELGGNNAIIITENADLDIAIRGALFGAVGTAGQRCTSTRRLIIHESVFEEVKDRLVAAYAKLTIGNPLDEKNIIGPLIDTAAVQNYLTAIERVKAEGGTELVAGGLLEGEDYSSGCYVTPSVFEAENHFQIVQKETFGPILYLVKYQEFEEAIAMQNNVPQGLSSAIMTTNMREAERYLSSEGSDCGISNVNIGTSGAEIGGAFGGEKETGGGRESGSDAWKAYMRRQTNTINYSTELPLAQGIKFDI
ncbi:aldehyde dehydrogenase family protein [Echinicola soli]|uniref:aldehyde dehydrogenase (NAD(+)) n=1 Tax=Echinicola soli TaxID=2591634 RepID=A0A514CDN5_9BACT|nr:aldehyde dehydrogenase family protein [Echinicola soli]QDH77927.1 aldehyde dehydrogenase family protein [Echinicola soli]